MKNPTRWPQSRETIEPNFEPDTALKTVVLYEDAESMLAAVQLLQRVARNLTDNATLHPAMWKFDHLVLPQLEHLAASDAAAAHLLVIASQDQFPLPEGIQILIDRWLKREDDQDRAIAALLFHDSTKSASRGVVQSYLLNLASQTNIRFFIHSQARDTRPNLPLATPVPSSWFRQFATGAPSSPATRWGLNE